MVQGARMGEQVHRLRGQRGAVAGRRIRAKCKTLLFSIVLILHSFLPDICSYRATLLTFDLVRMCDCRD
jgi:hypothetical protein